MSVQFPYREVALNPTDGQKFAEAMKKAGKPPQVADKVITMLKAEISEKNFNFVAGSLRFFSKDELTAVQEKIGQLKTQGDGKKIENLFKKAIDSTSDAGIKFALQKIYGAFTAQPALQHLPKFQSAAMAEETQRAEGSIVQTLKVLERIDTVNLEKLGSLKSNDLNGVRQFIFDNGEAIAAAVQQSKVMADIQVSHRPGASTLAAALKATVNTLLTQEVNEDKGMQLFLGMCQQLAKAEQLLK